MKVYCFPADMTGCGYYRLIWPAEALRAQGHDVTFVGPKQRDGLMEGVMRGETMVDVRVPADADVIVLQRVTSKYLVQAVSLIRAKGIAVVIDMDDDLTCIHPANPAFGFMHPRGLQFPDHSWENTLKACDAATLVTVSTDALAVRYGAKAPARVLHNMIPQWTLDIPHNDSATVGWAGAVFSHPTDPQVMGPTVAQLMRKGVKFKIVGPVVGVHGAFGLQADTPIEHTGIIGDIKHWPLAVNSIGIGVAPLAESKFNNAKSWLKVLEYAAVGVPSVASPRAEYIRAHKLGIGLLAHTPREWKTQLLQLVRDATLRQEVAGRSRSAAWELTIEGNAWRWHEAWAEALSLERKNSTMQSGMR